ncbi:hypothetical protein B0H10DRAFT_332608 [Mycena sp. CBHHK59/15]|nr:hypothetical protein B0H10DRAFT_332608 [Mycena sp. CBHHK59/15]
MASRCAVMISGHLSGNDWHTPVPSPAKVSTPSPLTRSAAFRMSCRETLPRVEVRTINSAHIGRGVVSGLHGAVVGGRTALERVQASIHPTRTPRVPLYPADPQAAHWRRSLSRLSRTAGERRGVVTACEADESGRSRRIVGHHVRGARGIGKQAERNQWIDAGTRPRMLRATGGKKRYVLLAHGATRAALRRTAHACARRRILRMRETRCDHRK